MIQYTLLDSYSILQHRYHNSLILASWTYLDIIIILSDLSPLAKIQNLASRQIGHLDRSSLPVH